MSDAEFGAPQPSTDGAGKSKEDVALLVANNNAALAAKQRTITEAARAALRKDLRATSSVPTPVAPSTPAATPVVAPTAPTPSALAEAFTAQLDAKLADAQRIRAEADAVRADANARASAAEAKLQKFINNPTSYLADQGLQLDQWQARLANGGEPTEQERQRADWQKQLAETVAPLNAELKALKAREFAQAETAALADARRILPENFPLVNHFVGPEAFLAELRRQVAASPGKPVDAEAVAKSMETYWTQKTQGALQDPKAAAKVGVSASSPPGTVAAQSPSTMTNRTTSSVPGAASRARNDAERKQRGREIIKQLAAEKRI